MFKYFDEGGGVFVYWEPEYKEDAIQITESVTGKTHKDGDFIEVTVPQRDQIIAQYDEIHPYTPIEEPVIEVSKEEIMLGMTSMYEDMLKRDAENKLALAEIFELTVGGME